MKFLPLIAGVVLLFGIATTSHAILIIDIYEQGDDVILNGSGTIDLTGLTQSANGAIAGNYMRPDLAYLLFRGPSDGSMWSYTGITGPGAIGTVMNNYPESYFSNYAFGLYGQGGQIYIDENYLGDEIVLSHTYLNDTLATLGLTTGTYEWTWASDSIQMNIGIEPAPAVPEPATLLLLGSGIACLAGVRRKADKS